MPNRLAHETSPYLLQHQNNPVDWYPWGTEALSRAKDEDKPIFLSIGYSACHWCHVMEHESFESESIARLINANFIPIKVDREERPDLDQVYMNAVQIMTGRGGWPMSVFLTPDLKPFYGGTYWPPSARMGMPGFDQVLVAVADAWKNRREAALDQANQLTEHLQNVGQGEVPVEGLHPKVPGTTESDPLTLELIEKAVQALARSFDARHGGFGNAPKFPHSMDLQLLLRAWSRQPKQSTLEMAVGTLDKMASGGIYDHLAGGFARYSVDERWLVPHFEKMLYDNSLLTSAYLDAFLATAEPRFARVARETCDYVLRYMTDPLGGFHSTEDADSEGEEGKFYVWTPQEIEQILGKERAERFNYVYDVTPQGNFEHGKSILNLPKTIEQVAALRGWNVEELDKELAESRTKLLVERDQRVRPGKDDKVLVSWNALMIDALARAAGILKEPSYLAAAEKATRFILESMVRPDGRLLHSWRQVSGQQGQAKLDAYLDDYTYLVNSLITLYQATFDEHWIDEAVRLADIVLARFEDKQRGGFFFTADDHEQLITRNKDLQDGSVPSGNAMAATALIRLGKLTGRMDYLEAARGALLTGTAVMERAPTAAGQMLIALDMWLGPMPEVVLLGGEADAAALLDDFRSRFLPRSLIAFRRLGGGYRSTHLEPLFHGKAAMDGAPTAFVCERFECSAPVSGTAKVRALWETLAVGSAGAR